MCWMLRQEIKGLSLYLLRSIQDFAVLLKLSGLGVVMASKSTSWEENELKRPEHTAFNFPHSSIYRYAPVYLSFGDPTDDLFSTGHHCSHYHWVRHHTDEKQTGELWFHLHLKRRCQLEFFDRQWWDNIPLWGLSGCGNQQIPCSLSQPRQKR